MAEQSFFQELVKVTGSEELAKKVIRLFDNTRGQAGLTEQQQAVYAYLVSGRPIVSQRQLAKDCGLDHPQKLVSTLAALVVKGHLVPKDKIQAEPNV